MDQARTDSIAPVAVNDKRGKTIEETAAGEHSPAASDAQTINQFLGLRPISLAGALAGAGAAALISSGAGAGAGGACTTGSGAATTGGAGGAGGLGGAKFCGC